MMEATVSINDRELGTIHAVNTQETVETGLHGVKTRYDVYVDGDHVGRALHDRDDGAVKLLELACEVVPEL